MDSGEHRGEVTEERLTAARLQLHWAIQAPAAVGKALLPGRADFSEQSFRWDERAAALAQDTVEAAVPFRAALRPFPPGVLLLDGEGSALAELPLAGRTVAEIYDELTAAVERLLARPLPVPLARPDGLSDHPLGKGAPFDAADIPAFAALGRLFGNAFRMIGTATAVCPGAGPVRCWPHHFDIASLVALDPSADPERARTIGVGLSPGDGGRPTPYLYVTPWPYPAPSALPSLPAGGIWNTKGWTGAMLGAGALLCEPGAELTADAALFLAAAVEACRRLLA